MEAEEAAAAAKREAREARKRKLLENSNNRLDRIRTKSNVSPKDTLTSSPPKPSETSKRTDTNQPETTPTVNKVTTPTQSSATTNRHLTVIRLVYCALIGIASNHGLIPASLILLVSVLLSFSTLLLTTYSFSLPASRFAWAESLIAWAYPQGLTWIKWFMNVIKGVEFVAQDLCMCVFFTVTYYIIIYNVLVLL
ncbi:PREDICTED: uncharacterized protein LOC100634719 [Amphimedon queenslandica]|uniref:Uncharacterized protein n=1 Tax=Amphimedon queenslandica TaxID=400682 RepID=A0A1X7VQT9_AMPQE|nr:PREDICTED: uncharacterized protein LOC100634719 [Amphimedon queenslandica]|eukprot:XP_003383162.1 PREDICTED: uncharacterized protein LOC100634719 [Amphimedon queenslandica]